MSLDDGENILVRHKEIYDSAIPSGNSIGTLNLLRLGRITADPGLESKAKKIWVSFSKRVNSTPYAYPQFMVELDFGIGLSYEVLIAGNLLAEDTRTMLKIIRERFIPNKIVLFRSSDVELSEITNIARFTKNLVDINDKATAYVCRNYSCKLPTTDVNKMLEWLGINEGGC